MSEHPIEDLKNKAEKQADVSAAQRKSWLWRQEYRNAYAAVVGLDDDIPIVPDAGLQAYLRELDTQVIKLRTVARAEIST